MKTLAAGTRHIAEARTDQSRLHAPAAKARQGTGATGGDIGNRPE